ncbi:MAG: Uma2 family endonuclease [Mycobacteriales bacterium]
MTSATAEAPLPAANALYEALLHHDGPWTVADLDALGLDEKLKIEIDDGSLLVSPSPTREHQKVEYAIEAALNASLGKRHDISHDLDVVVDRPRYYRPDIVVSVRDWLPPHRGYRLTGADVALAVEIESPGTLSYDRVIKLRAYARAGIPAYWRVEIDPLRVVEHRLTDPDSAEYEIVGQHDAVLRTEFPGPVEIDLRAIEEDVFGRFR